MAAKRIYLSPSNQDGNTYATGKTNEMVQCDKIANATAVALRRCGFEVKVGRSGDGMAIRCRESDAFNADIHMPIHTNAYNGKVIGGTRIFCYSSSNADSAPSKAVLKTLGEISPGTADSVTVNKGLYEVNTPKAITVYIECEFHDTKTGSDWIINNTTAIAEAIAKGMCNHFGVTYKTTDSNTKPNDTKPSTPAKPSTPSTTKPSSSGTLNKTSKFKGTVIANDGLNVRSWAGTNYDVLRTLKNGTTVDVCDTVKDKDGKTWYYIEESNKFGFVSSDYVSKNTSTTKPSSSGTLNKTSKFKGVVNANGGLNVRSWAGTEHEILRTLKNGTTVDVCDTVKDKKGKTWYYIEESNKFGFVSSDYVSKK